MSTLLPNEDKHQKCRQKELSKKRGIYIYNHNLIPGVGMNDGLPFKEFPRLFWVIKLIGVGSALMENLLAASENYAYKIGKFILPHIFKVKMVIRLLLNILINKDPNAFFTRGGEYILQYLRKGEGLNLTEYNSLFATIKIPEKSADFLSDKNFADMRLAGWNPAVIEGIKKIPKNFPFTNKLLKEIDGFQDETIDKLLKTGRAYLVNYEILSILKDGNQPMGKKFTFAPMALLFLNKDRSELLPVAIQCGQDPKKFPIFTPKDDFWAWNIAKLIVNSADGNYHEVITHLGKTHLVIEPIVVATHRQLSERHPLFKLLYPHFNGTIYINYLAKEKLIAPGGGVDYLLSGTIESDVAVALKAVGSSGFNDSFFPEFFKNKNTINNELLPDYPYRDDGLLIWEEIKKWVDSYLRLYYKSDEDIKNDVELNLWVSELTSPVGAGIKNFGDNGDGKIETLEYLTLAITYIIFTASAAHSSVNFPQKDLMMYTPGVPLGVYHNGPEKNRKYSEEDWMKMLPPLNMASLQLNLGYTLGGVYYTKLGNYSNFNDHRAIKLCKEFKKSLKKAEGVLKGRNAYGRIQYEYMYPSRITQSINI
ncbi:MAG: hypothetical protein KDK36_13545 [Leptospiraceae bacterium]|nr:hypothetical protein [Leptospiraceae bacterium]